MQQPGRRSSWASGSCMSLSWRVLQIGARFERPYVGTRKATCITTLPTGGSSLDIALVDAVGAVASAVFCYD